jgi:glutathione synthase/RimK-type ligase-like ATP-grasp enzyme
MTKSIYFDVLVVYNEKNSHSASDPSDQIQTPFSKKFGNESYNVVYGHFLKVCKEMRLKVALTSSVDIIGPGLCRSFWSFKNKKWLKTNSLCSSNLIFDKFAPTNRGIKSRRKLLFSISSVKPFNSAGLFNLFFNKQATYEKLAKYSIPTVSLQENTTQSINEVCDKLKVLADNHPNFKDFGSDIVMKDQFGAGGENVYKFKQNQSAEILKTVLENKSVSFIVQPFVKFDKGFTYQNLPASTDIRLVFLAGEIVQSYIRIAKDGDFRCNEHLGGALTYLPITAIPQKIIKKAALIADLLNEKKSLYALDFVISNNGNVFLLEGNTMPGLDWNMSIKDNETKAKKLIKMVVEQLILRTKKRISKHLPVSSGELFTSLSYSV